MHGSEWTVPSCDTFNLGFIIIQCRTNDRALYVLSYGQPHPFYSPFSGTTRVSRYQKGKTNLDILKQQTVSGSGISWDICKSATRSRQITMPAPHHSVFYRPDALPAAQPTASKHWRHFVWTTTSLKLYIIFWDICHPKKHTDLITVRG